MWAAAADRHTAFSWRYGSRRDRLDRLYESAKAKQWDANERLDWSTECDPANPLGITEGAVPIAGSRTWQRLGAHDRELVVHHLAAWQFSQFLHGEQGGLVCAARIVESVPDIDSKLMASTQVGDEARHVEVFARFNDEKLEVAYPIHPSLQVLLGTIVGESRWDMPFLAQVLIEGLALAAFGIVRDTTTNPLVRSLMASVMEDEARHVAFSRLALAGCYAEASAGELREREDFCIEATVMMRDRFLAHEVWDRLGLDVAECTAQVERSPTEQAFRRLLFSRIVPTLRDIGLLGPRVREHLDGLGVLGFESVDLDRTLRADALAARLADAARRALPQPADES